MGYHSKVEVVSIGSRESVSCPGMTLYSQCLFVKVRELFDESCSLADIYAEPHGELTFWFIHRTAAPSPHVTNALISGSQANAYCST